MRAVDLRSDTVTRPTPAMRKAMAEAEVGDDVWGDDPTVIELEAEVARRLGKGTGGAAGGRPRAETPARVAPGSVCFGRGRGARVGWAVVGSAGFTVVARRNRKLFGGGMRQAGIIAAGALHALRHHVERLADDHRNARRLAEGLRSARVLRFDPEAVETNIVIAKTTDSTAAPDIVSALADAGVPCAAL